jgi:hypothetical protein
VNEPDNHTAWTDEDGDTWVRVDECALANHNWFALTDDPEPGTPMHAQDAVGAPFRWEQMAGFGLREPADPGRTARALERVRREWAGR